MLSPYLKLLLQVFSKSSFICGCLVTDCDGNTKTGVVSFYSYSSVWSTDIATHGGAQHILLQKIESQQPNENEHKYLESLTTSKTVKVGWGCSTRKLAGWQACWCPTSCKVTHHNFITVWSIEGWGLYYSFENCITCIHHKILTRSCMSQQILGDLNTPVW